jgi:hypothetical protein
VVVVQTTLTPRLSPADVMAVVRDVANRSRNDMKPSVRFSVVTATNLTSSELMLDQLHVRMVRGTLKLCVVTVWLTPFACASPAAWKCYSQRVQVHS